MQELPVPEGAGTFREAFFLKSPREVAAWDASGSLWRWSVESRKWSAPWKPPVISQRWTISPDGKWFAALSGREAFLCRTEPDAPPMRYPLHARGQNVALSDDGRWFAASDALGNVNLVDGQHPERAPVELRGHLNAVHSLLFTADATRLVTLCSHEEAARFWAVPSGEELITLTGTTEVTGAEFACGGDVLLVHALNGWHAWRAPPMSEIDALSPSGEW
jgi:WD40 repeat protein